MAGRSPQKLDELRATLAAAHQDVPLIVADAANEIPFRSMGNSAPGHHKISSGHLSYVHRDPREDRCKRPCYEEEGEYHLEPLAEANSCYCKPGQ